MSILDFPRLDLGAVLRPLGQDDDILGRWRMRHGLDTCFLVGFSTVPGSERPRYTQGRIIGPCDQSESVRVTIMLRRKNAREFERLVREFERRQTSDPIKPLSSEEFARRFGADSADIQTVAAFAAQAGLQVEETDIGRRIVVLSGTVRNMNKAFGVRLQNCEEGGRAFRVREGGISVPDTIAGIVTGVFGLDQRPQAIPHFRLQSAATQPVAFSPIEVADLYDFPPNTTGAGETVGIIELGGGFETSDLNTFFQGLGISTPPQVTAISVDGPQNVPGGDPNGADSEVELDIEVVGAVAPGAAQKVFFAPNTDQGFMDAVSAAIQDTDVSTVWNDTAEGLGATGGGVSNVFSLPEYQANANVPLPQNPNGGRGVPDVSGDADPDTGYNVLIDGSSEVIGGTSAVAPLYAGPFARINEALLAQDLPRVGFVNPKLYQFPVAFHDITMGNNGAFQAGPGWDAATGLGSPIGTSLLADLSTPSTPPPS